LFFHIGQLAQENFSHWYQLGQFHVSTDAGWYQHCDANYTAVYKGYADSDRLINLLDQIVQQTQPELFGNFCVIVYDHVSGRLQIQTDRLRSFPIYIGDDSVTNLVPTARTAWTDSLVSIDRDFAIAESKFDVIGPIDTTPVTTEQAVDLIHDRLTEKTQSFLKFNTLPVRAFLSGGIDSLLVYSYLQRFSQDVELVKCNIIEYDQFWLQNSGDISGHWAYRQIHHWIKPCVLTSGAPGDEFMLVERGG
jgi:hypothetical protein